MFNISYSQVNCPDYKVDGIAIDTSVVIGPVRIFEEESQGGGKVYDFVIGCNKFYHCENASCAYSYASRMEKRKEATREVG